MTTTIDVDGRKMTVADFEKADGLYVRRSLDLSGTAIATLPKGLSVGENLYLSATNVTDLPESMFVGW